MDLAPVSHIKLRVARLMLHDNLPQAVVSGFCVVALETLVRGRLHLSAAFTLAFAIVAAVYAAVDWQAIVEDTVDDTDDADTSTTERDGVTVAETSDTDPRDTEDDR